MENNNKAIVYIKDQLGRELQMKQAPRRIVSLVPSITELLSYLELDDQIVGITKFCILPDHVYRSKPRIGGTKQVHYDQIDLLNPDLIIANKEENTAEIVEKLAEKYPVYVSDILNTEDALTMIEDLGLICNRKTKAEILVREIRTSFDEIIALHKHNTKFKAAYLVWHNPIMVAGCNTYIDSILNLLHLENAFHYESRYPKIDIQKISEQDIDILILPSEPFPFKEKHRQYFKELLPDIKVILIHGEIFSWYGSYMLNIKTAYLSIQNTLNN